MIVWIFYKPPMKNTDFRDSQKKNKGISAIDFFCFEKIHYITSFIHPPESNMRSPAFLFLALFFLLPTDAFGSFEHRGPDARIEAMGGAGAALENPPFGPFYNPAAGNRSNGSSAGISYALPFGESSFDSFYGILQTGTLPFDRNGSASISWQHYGSSLYSESCTYATYSTKITGAVRAGASVGLLQRDSPGRGTESAIGINLGVLTTFSPLVKLGASVFNLNKPESGRGNENAPMTAFAGASYKPAGNIIVSAAMEKPEKKETRLLTGGEVRILKFLSLRAGFATGPSTFSGGVGIMFKNVQGDISLVRHPELGTGSWYTMRVAF